MIDSFDSSRLIFAYGINLGIGDRVDCLDTETKWRQGEIVRVESTRVEVHFIGWSPRYDEWISRDSYKLQPPNTITNGWTGQMKKTPSSDEVQASVAHGQPRSWLNQPYLSGVQRQFEAELAKIPPTMVDHASIRRQLTTYNFKSEGRRHALKEIVIKNHTKNTIVNMETDGLIVDGEPFLFAANQPDVQMSHSPNASATNTTQNDSNLIRLEGKYIYQYSVANEESQLIYQQECTNHRAEIEHCKKLLHDLPIALTNSQQKLTEQKKCENVELAELGALLLEQDRITAEIQSQQTKLLTLESNPPKMDPHKFQLHQFQPKLNLTFGWHQFDGIIYEMIRLQPTAQVQLDPMVLG